MHPGPRPTAALLLALAAALPAAADAQLVPIRTIPVADGDQFLVHPSDRLGMGDVSVALPDTLGDPFVVPGAGSRVPALTVDVSPTLYVISEGFGSGRTLPVSVLFGGESWFGGGSLALQEIREEDDDGRFSPRLDDLSALNTYVSGYLGRRVGRAGWSLGVGASRASLSAMDGVELLYGTGFPSVEQNGSITDVRAGALLERPDGGALELVALFHRVDMDHEIRPSGGWGWFDQPIIAPCPPEGCPPPTPREEEDETRTWGAAATWSQPVGERGWRAGGTLTVNRKSHPKIPNYDLMQIPRDPGDTWAWRLGAGVARSRGGTTVALDLAVEPVSTETWADAVRPIIIDSVVVVEPGERTVENEFAFFNSRVRFGFEHRGDRWSFQLGSEVYAVSYDLEQEDFIRRRTRDQSESWLEWTPTWGLGLRLGEAHLRYVGRYTTGTGRPAVGADRGFDMGLGAVAGADWIPAPRGALVLDGAGVLTQRLGVVIPAG